MLLCLGDSITAEPQGWPSRLDVPVDVRAVAGAKVGDVFAQLEDVPPVGAVVCTVGSNDALAIGAPVDVAAFTELAAKMWSVAPRAAMLDVLLFAPTYPGLRAQRDAVRVVLSSLGVDVIRTALPPWCWRRDRIHPNGRGQARIARAVTRWLEAEQVVP